MTVRRFLRHVGVGVMLAGLALAIAVVALPPGWTQVRVDRPLRIVYLQADRGALRAGTVDGPLTLDPPLLPKPKRASNVREFLSWQFAVGGAIDINLLAGNRPYGSRGSILGVSVERFDLANAVGTTAPVWTRRELRLPAWLLALPGLIWISIRLRRKIVNRSRPNGFDVLPVREGQV